MDWAAEQEHLLGWAGGDNLGFQWAAACVDGLEVLVSYFVTVSCGKHDELVVPLSVVCVYQSVRRV